MDDFEVARRVGMKSEAVVGRDGDPRIRRLFWMRNVVILAITAAILVATAWFKVNLPVSALISILALLVFLNGFTAWHMRRRASVSDAHVFVQLVCDVALLAAGLHVSGGATNPFVSLFLLPVIFAAMVLPARFTWAMAAITATAYSALMVWYRPLDADHAYHSDAFGLHVLGMWFNFVFSASLVAVFVVRIAASLRERDLELAAARERALRDEQLVTLGTFAAGAAHELGTPLATIAVVAKELEATHSADASLRDDLRVLRAQVDVCKRILTEMIDRTGRTRSEGASLLALDELIGVAVSRWQLLRPGAQVNILIAQRPGMPMVAAEETLIQTFVSLLNNAADASPGQVDLSCDWSEHEIAITIRDHGPGISAAAHRNAGKQPYSGKVGAGLGVGLLLATATIERVGGRIIHENRASGGLETRVRLPISVPATP